MRDRAEYGLEIIKRYPKLSDEYGRGFTKTNLYSFLSVLQNLPGDFPRNEWKIFAYAFRTHYRTLLQVKDERLERDMQRKLLNRHGRSHLAAQH